jgi:hypothetical protein
MTEHEIHLERIERHAVTIRVRGTAPLIMSRFSEKARQQMLDAQMGKTRQKKQPKNPQADYERSMHRLPDDSPGFPAVGFKAATVGAARYFEGITMKALSPALFFVGEGPEQLVRILGEPKMREDMVRVGGNTADLRFRAQFDEWEADLRIVYVPLVVSAESLVALVDAGGSGGIGEWRPSKSHSGSYGTYQVVEDDDSTAGSARCS